METANLYASWIGILLGFAAGTIQGSFFHDDLWLGGYASWPRRLTRLGHISFFGIAFVNLAYVATVRLLPVADPGFWPSRLFILGAITMPLVCYLAAFWKRMRHLFAVPVLSLLAAAVILLFEMSAL